MDGEIEILTDWYWDVEALGMENHFVSTAFYQIESL